jgi:vacuolar-type H+-ATPase catalytic subunit A/Vma1
MKFQTLKNIPRAGNSRRFVLPILLILLVGIAEAMAQTQIYIGCGESSKDLGTVNINIVPTGAIVTWHTGTPATAANKIANSSAVPAGTYYAAFYDAIGGCYSPTSAILQVIKKVCIPCGESNYNLTTVSTNTAPTGAIVTWHTSTPATAINKIANSSAVPAGTYYAAFYDAIGGCYSPTSAILQVINNSKH